MKAKVLYKDFVDALDAVIPAVSTRATLPICQTIRIWPNADNGISLSATNLDMFITTQLGGQVEPGPGVCVTAKLFQEIIKSLGGDSVELDNQQNPNILKVSSGRFRSSFNGMSEEEFPPMPTADRNNAIELDSSVIKQLARSSFACATEDTRPVLRGVCLNLSRGLIETAGADGFRLAVVSIPAEGQTIEGRFVIDPRVMAILKKMTGDKVKLSLGRQLFVSTQRKEMVANCIDGTFPEYQKLIPDGWKTTVTVMKQDMLNALKLASVVNDLKGPVKLKISQGNLTFESKFEDDNTRGTIDAAVSGEDASIAVDVRYASAAVEALESEKIMIKLNRTPEPMMFCAEDDRLRTVVMPMFINW